MPDMRQVNVRVNEYFGDEQILLSFPDGWKVNLVEMACKDAPPLDDEEIRSALDNSEGAPSITERARAQQISDQTGLWVDDDLPFGTTSLIEELHYLGIETISELELRLSENREILTKWAVEWLTPEPDEPKDMPNYVGPEIPIFYLNYCLAGQTGSIENTIEFLSITRKRQPKLEELAKNVIDIYNKYKIKN